MRGRAPPSVARSSIVFANIDFNSVRYAGGRNADTSAMEGVNDAIRRVCRMEENTIYDLEYAALLVTRV